MEARSTADLSMNVTVERVERMQHAPKADGVCVRQVLCRAAYRRLMLALKLSWTPESLFRAWSLDAVQGETKSPGSHVLQISS
jgi:hypothetical protein